MAGEIKYNMGMTLSNGELNDTYNTSGLTADQTNEGLMRNVQPVTIASAGDSLDIGSVTTPRMALFSNLDDVNFVEVGIQVSGNFHAFLRLDAGVQAGPMWLGTTDLYARANTDTVKLFYILYEE